MIDFAEELKIVSFEREADKQLAAQEVRRLADEEKKALRHLSICRGVREYLKGGALDMYDPKKGHPDLPPQEAGRAAAEFFKGLCVRYAVNTNGLHTDAPQDARDRYDTLYAFIEAELYPRQKEVTG